jgi:hypothetical protein
MKTCYYLYDSDLTELKNMKYIDALKYKIGLARNVIYDLNCAHYMKRDSIRINDCLSAIKFNETLIKEIQS